jgi:hypothetical protein
VLRLRRAVLTAVARRGSTPEEMSLMHKLGKLSEDERRRLIGEFLDTAFGDLAARLPGFGAVVRSMTPELPDNPESEQVQAWVELAELSQDLEFRVSVRRSAELHAAEDVQSDTGVPRPDTVAAVREQVEPALLAGLDPAAAAVDPVVSAITARYAQLLDAPDDVGLRRRLLSRLETAGDPRRERYLQLLAVINGWPAPDSLAPVVDWFIRALQARVPEEAEPAQSSPPPQQHWSA